MQIKMNYRENILIRLYLLYCFTFRVLGPDSFILNFQILLTQESMQRLFSFVFLFMCLQINKKH